MERQVNPPIHQIPVRSGFSGSRKAPQYVVTLILFAHDQSWHYPCRFGLRPIHVFRTTLETELKMRVGVYEYLHSTNLMVSVVSWFQRSYVFLTR